jgi:hypothetical protein
LSIAPRQRSNVFSGVENSARGGGSLKVIDLILSRGSSSFWPPLVSMTTIPVEVVGQLACDLGVVREGDNFGGVGAHGRAEQRPEGKSKQREQRFPPC